LPLTRQSQSGTVGLDFLYEQLGSPAYVSRYSWSFVYKATRQPQFHGLTLIGRCIFRAIQVLDILMIALTIVIVIQLVQVRGWGKLFGL
jgi:hypothetical protein